MAHCEMLNALRRSSEQENAHLLAPFWGQRMGAFADVLVLLLMLCIVQRTVEFFCEDMQKFSIEVTELEIKRDYYLNKLVAKNIMALLRSLL